MHRFFTSALLGLTLFTGHAAFANPQQDAALIADRTFGDALDAQLIEILKGMEVSNYRRQLLTHNITIIDEQAFAAILPPPDSHPMLEGRRADLAAKYLKVLTPDQLAEIAQTMRLIEDITLDEILSESHRVKMEQSYADALADLDTTQTDDPLAQELKLLTAQLTAMNEVLGDEEFAESIVLSALPAFSFIGLLLQPPGPDLPLANPYVIEALETDGIVRGSNRIVVKDLITQLRADMAAESVETTVTETTPAQQPRLTRVGTFAPKPPLVP